MVEVATPDEELFALDLDARLFLEVSPFEAPDELIRATAFELVEAVGQ